VINGKPRSGQGMDILNITPKGLGLPYVGFSDSGQAAVNALYFLKF
jgi:hypothetical protein